MTDAQSRVLIVDDEVFFLEAIDEILSGAGLETELAADGAAALAAVTDPSIGVVVLDVRLPDMDGIQVLAQIRELRPELSVIMLSASTDQEIVLEALRLGATDYLAKPLHDEELVLAVGRSLESYHVNAERRRLRGRIDRLVDGMERLSQLVRLASAEERAAVLRQGVVDAASVVLQASRTSLMLADTNREWLSVVASRGADVSLETMQSRKVGEGAAGVCFAEGAVLCIEDAGSDPRFAGRASGKYESGAFAVVPLVCLGVSVGVLCLTEAEDAEDLSLDATNLLRLLGMQVSEFLAADPEVERLLLEASALEAEGVDPLDEDTLDGDAELASAICQAMADEMEPERVLRQALTAVSTRLGAAPVSLYLASADGATFELEAEADGGIAGDRPTLPADEGLAGVVAGSGRLVAAPSPAADGRFDARVDTASDGEVRPYLCVPLALRGKTVGLLRVFPEAESGASPRTAEVLAAAFSAAVRNLLLYRSLLESIEEVAQVRREARG